MKLEQSFEVAAPLERVWAALIDVEHVAPCLPGAAVTGRNEDGSYNGTFKVKIGPTSAAYSGKLFMENVDEAAHSATMNASGSDKRGQGGAKATIISTVSEGPSGTTTVAVITDYHITGRLARFGRGGMIEEISNRLLGQFATSLQASLADGGVGEAALDANAGAEALTPGVQGEGPRTEAPQAGGVAARSEPAAGSDPAAESNPAAESAPAAESDPAAGSASASDSAHATGAPSVESKPVEGLSLVATVLLSQARRNPAPIAALVIGFLVALRFLRRR